MSRLIIIPQYPAKLRYQEWWFTEFPRRFSAYFSEVLLLGRNVMEKQKRADISSFSPAMESMAFEAMLIEEYNQLTLKKDDTLLLCDLSYPGIFPMFLLHKRPDKCFAICHATSLNRYDYFSKVRTIKYPIEKAVAKLFVKVFVASEYHKRKLGWGNIIVQPLPDSPFYSLLKYSKNRIYNLVSVSRSSKQKVTYKLEKKLQRDLNQTIVRPTPYSWEDYYNFLSRSKILVITSKEETFGYQVLDAVNNGCIPIAPNGMSYSELLPKVYLYDSYEELKEKILKGLRGELPVPEILKEEQIKIQNFYENVSNILKNE